jgi:hypothetical protein
MNRLSFLHPLTAALVLAACVACGVDKVYPQEPSTAAGAPETPTLALDGAPNPKLLVMLATKIGVDPNDPVQQRIFAEYGAVFAAGNGAVPPPRLVFATANEVSTWQAEVPTRRERLGRHTIELQAPAMEALLAARAEARARRLDITPRGSDAARRSYEDTVKLWRSRVEPALDYWVGANRLAVSERDRIRRLAPNDQVPEVLGLERRGLWFSTDFSKSILYSVAAPGTSQHLSMLALDVAEFENAAVREILARHGWFQTVQTDLPHFTYLGAAEEDLPALGLRRVMASRRAFWIPDFGDE